VAGVLYITAAFGQEPFRMFGVNQCFSKKKQLHFQDGFVEAPTTFDSYTSGKCVRKVIKWN
jgi:hypothetical protein